MIPGPQTDGPDQNPGLVQVDSITGKTLLKILSIPTRMAKIEEFAVKRA